VIEILIGTKYAVIVVVVFVAEGSVPTMANEVSPDPKLPVQFGMVEVAGGRVVLK
jgi:hypothetical protein